MSTDDDADDDVGGTGTPLPLEDRLWRHPSELSSAFPAPAVSTVGRGPAWPIALVAGLVGATLFGGAMAVTGFLASEGQQRVVEKVAVTPVVSSPMVQGERGVSALMEQVGPSVARLQMREGTSTAYATAVVWRDDGLLLTSAHEVVGVTSISVLLHDGRRLEGKLVGVDLPTDVAVVSVDALHLPVAVMGSSADIEVGSPTIAVGSPSDTGADPSVTTGVVSAIERRLDAGGEVLHGLIQTDAPIEPGWSGGPLVDATGAVVGISTDMAGAGGGFGFATPIDLVYRIAEELVASGKVIHAWLGIEGADLSDDQAETMDVPGGAIVRRVIDGSPAARGGLAPDDVITEVGERGVVSSSGLVLAMRHHKPGEQVVVGYWRNGRHHQATVTIDERP